MLLYCEHAVLSCHGAVLVGKRPQMNAGRRLACFRVKRCYDSSHAALSCIGAAVPSRYRGVGAAVRSWPQAGSCGVVFSAGRIRMCGRRSAAAAAAAAAAAVSCCPAALRWNVPACVLELSSYVLPSVDF